jgi:hypothetical protein
MTSGSTRSVEKPARRACSSGRQAVAALVAPRFEDGPPRPGGHAMPKAVTLRSFAIVGLIRALHLCPLPRAIGSGPSGWRRPRVPGARNQGRLAPHGRNGRGRAGDQAIRPPAPTPAGAKRPRSLSRHGEKGRIHPLDACGQSATVPRHGRNRGLVHRCSGGIAPVPPARSVRHRGRSGVGYGP